ncbi:hypothetical protein QBC44DRAFT_325625 [Cladorrhinum sp. PSN332]|nr:hypothetical protein QBC44DRAFT_325625 [Cladorrhinum sp. PSN332]
MAVANQQTPASLASDMHLANNNNIIINPSTEEQEQEQDDTAVWSLRHLQTLWSWTARPSKPSYPPISSIPQTPLARLSEPDAQPAAGEQLPTEPILTKSAHHEQSNTVLYLAYGSNLCAKTFLGMRGIRPLSQLNVSAPSLDLIFDLPGLPYKEPCFANTTLRKIPNKPPPLPPLPPINPPPPPPPPPPTRATQSQRDLVWDKGLYGVVYEVTQSDYAKIIATEGGGSSYHDILVPCFPLPPSVGIPEKPAIPIPRPFLARTLYAPRLPPDAPTPPSQPPLFSSSSSSSEDDDNKSRLPSWLKKLLLPLRRPSPTYAQPSPRYLSLILTGAQEHELPQEYISHLSRLQPYTVTTHRQKIGQFVFTAFWFPVFVLVMLGGRLFSDKQSGKAPGWVSAATTVMINLVWGSYDYVAKPVFGDGERTLEEEEKEKEKEEERVVVRTRRGSRLWNREEGMDEEKRGLLA